MQDIHSAISIEEDVIDLNNKVQQLQEEVRILSENQATTDERYTRVKQDNTTLTARIHMLEEHIREIEVRGEERLEEKQGPGAEAGEGETVEDRKLFYQIARNGERPKSTD